MHRRGPHIERLVCLILVASCGGAPAPPAQVVDPPRAQPEATLPSWTPPEGRPIEIVSTVFETLPAELRYTLVDAAGQAVWECHEVSDGERGPTPRDARCVRGAVPSLGAHTLLVTHRRGRDEPPTEVRVPVDVEPDVERFRLRLHFGERVPHGLVWLRSVSLRRYRTGPIAVSMELDEERSRSAVAFRLENETSTTVWPVDAPYFTARLYHVAEDAGETSVERGFRGCGNTGRTIYGIEPGESGHAFEAWAVIGAPDRELEVGEYRAEVDIRAILSVGRAVEITDAHRAVAEARLVDVFTLRAPFIVPANASASAGP